MKGIIARRDSARALAVLAVTMMLGALTVFAAAETPKTYTVSMSPSSIAPGTPTAVTFTVANTSASIAIGESWLSVPAGVSAAGYGGTIPVGSIPAGQSAQVTVTVTASCDGSPYHWGSTAKQNTPGQGEGIYFTLVGGSPAMTVATCAGAGTTTTTAAPTTTTTAAPTTTTTVLGPFEPTTTTTTTSTTTTTLAPFVPPIPTSYSWDLIEPCVGQTCETEPLEFGNTIGQLYGGDAANVLFLSVRSSDEVPDYCGYDFHHKSETVIFDVWGYQAEKIVEVTVLGIGEDGDFEAEDFEVCFGGEEPFTQKDDRGPAVFGDGLYFGLLPDCEDDDGEGWPGPEYAFWDDEFALGGGNYGPAPCVAWRDLDDETGDLTVIVLAPPGDPRIKIG